MSGLDNPVAMIGNRAVVQGSTLKGFLRSRIETYLIDRYPNDKVMKPCVPSSENTLSADETLLIQDGKYREKGACQYSSEDGRKRSSTICPACYFLGAMGLPGFVRVPYLFTEKRPEELYSVRVDRAKATVVDKTNRDYQLMADNTVFTGVMEVAAKDTVTKWELGKPRKIQNGTQLDSWLSVTSVKFGKRFSDLSADELIKEFILDRLNGEGIIGGFKSKGCGKVSIEVRPRNDDTPLST
jgi:CRISPR/Cas system CSM-associated protein Csm3 (group 7 of RAMP superfamily)